MHEFKILDPLVDCNLDSTLKEYSGYSFFLRQYGRKYCKKTYGNIPKYFTVMDGSDIISIVPVMEINSFITGSGDINDGAI